MTEHDLAAGQGPHSEQGNGQQEVADRISAILSRMTVEEKAGQLCQFFYFGGLGEPPADFDADTGADLDTLVAETRAFARQPRMVEDAIGAGRAGSVLFVKDPATANRLQRLAVEGSRLGIPLLFGFDVIHGWRTIFPVPIGLAASWDPATVEAVQAAAAREARAAGVHWTFAPMVDIARDPRWGRIVEGAGEDPHLGAEMAAAQVRGFQGNGDAAHILAGPKHFAGYGAARGGRDYDDVEISDSEFWNVYIPPFRAAVKAGAANVMSAYMDLNGVPASGNRWLLTDALRGELGFQGFTVSDANAVRSLETQHFARDQLDAAVRALSAGLDMEMAIFGPAFFHLPEATGAGLIDDTALDDAVRRVLLAKFRLGLFEHPYVDESPTTPADHADLAREAAERSAVLLKNDGLLPLDPSRIKSIAVLGPLADSPRDTLGPWVFAQDTAATVTILDGIRQRVGSTVPVDYAPGVRLPPRLIPSPFDRMDPTVPTPPPDFDDDAELGRAVEEAARADVAVVVVGQPQNQIGETASTSTLELPGRQLDLLQAVAATGTPTVAVLLSGRPLDLAWPDEHLPAILHLWYPGSRGGQAAARLLFGDATPGGRLPFTWPRAASQLPMIYAHNRTFAPQDQDKRYWDAPSTPLYPFGYGLSYASFAYSPPRLARDAMAVGESTTVAVEVTNTADRPGDEVVQFYIHQRSGTSSRPVRELKGFDRIHLEPGQTTTVTFPVGPDQLCYWSAATKGWVQDPTMLDLWVGGNSTTGNAAVLQVTAPAAGGAI